MKNSTKRVLSIGFAAIFFIATLAVYGNFIRPEMDTIQEKRSKVNAKENMFESKQLAVSQVEQIISTFQNANKFKETVSLAIPENPNVTNALGQLQAIARSNSVDFLKFSVKQNPPIASKGLLIQSLNALTLDLGVRGTYEGVKGFLRSIETNVRIANTKSVNLMPTKDTKQGSEGLYDLNMSVDIFYQ
jgi:Tfp pilus assembly protein PilO